MSIHRSPTFIAFSLAAFLSILASFAYTTTVLQGLNSITDDPAHTERLRGIKTQASPHEATVATYKLARSTRQYALNGHGLTEKDVEILACPGCFRISVSFLHDSEINPGGLDSTTLTAYYYDDRLQETKAETETVEVGPLMSCDPEPTKPIEPPIADANLNRDPGGNVGAACTSDLECQTPMSYLIQSNCPYGSKCVDNECRVVCSFFPDQEAADACQTDADCALCNETYPRAGATCRCLDNRCHRIEPRDGPRT